MCAPLWVWKTPDQYRAALAAVQLDELHAVLWGGWQIRLRIDQAENDSCKAAFMSSGLPLAWLLFS
jgi:hypothetical protein